MMIQYDQASLVTVFFYNLFNLSISCLLFEVSSITDLSLVVLMLLIDGA